MWSTTYRVFGFSPKWLVVVFFYGVLFCLILFQGLDILKLRNSLPRRSLAQRLAADVFFWQDHSGNNEANLRWSVSVKHNFNSWNNTTRTAIVVKTWKKVHCIIININYSFPNKHLSVCDDHLPPWCCTLWISSVSKWSHTCIFWGEWRRQRPRVLHIPSSCFLFHFQALALESSLLLMPTQACLRIVCQMFRNEAESALQALSALRCWLPRLPSSSHKALIRHGDMILCWARCSCYITYWIINVFISRSLASFFFVFFPLPLQNLLTRLLTTRFGSFLLVWPSGQADGLVPKRGDSLAKTARSKMSQTRWKHFTFTCCNNC